MNVCFFFSPHQEHGEVVSVLGEVRHHSHHGDALLGARHVRLLSFGVAEVQQLLHVAQVPQRADASEDAAANHQHVFGPVNQEQLVVVVRVHGLLAGVSDRRRALPVVPFGARLGAGLHLQVRVQLVEGVDGADVQPARMRIRHHVIDQTGRGELCAFTMGWAEVNRYQGDQKVPRPPPLHRVWWKKTKKEK